MDLPKLMHPVQWTLGLVGVSIVGCDAMFIYQEYLTLASIAEFAALNTITY